MNDVIDKEDQAIDAAQAPAQFDTALIVLEAWIRILREEIRAECGTGRPVGKRLQPLKRKLEEAISVGRKLRPGDHAAASATIACYCALIDTHRSGAPHGA